MSVRLIRVNGRKVWQARVSYSGLRASSIVEIDPKTGEKLTDKPLLSKADARQAEAHLIRALKAQAGQAEEAGARPATLRGLFTWYVAGLEARGKGPDTINRAARRARSSSV